ncbi:MAG TPA: putative lipid II flippase FtsW [Thioalkalivibrio sp.]|nr:putative lipid II flippase FtsW [Thioalkalivibrio sp.]
MNELQASRTPQEKIAVKVRQHLDVGLVLVVATLLGLGLVMVTSASIGVAEKQTGNPLYFFERQLVFVLAGIAVAAAIYRVRLVHWQTAGFALLLLTFVLLALVLVPGIGKTVNGSTRWIPLGIINLQVSELAKLCFVVYVAGYLVRHGNDVRETFSGFMRPVLVLGLAAALMLMEPDFGAAAVLMATGLGMLFLGGVRLGQFGLLMAVVAAALAVLAVSSPYRLERLTTFLNPWADPFNSGFQLTQSLIAIGSGSWTGLGLGGSIQKLFYLPEAHNDFLFAVLAEELGLLGVIVVVGLYAYLVWRCFAIAAAAENCGHAFGAYLAYGVGIWAGLQAFINMGVNMGILPTKGLTLPLMSAGGSSMLVMCAAIGLLLRVHRETVQAGVQLAVYSNAAMRKTRPAREKPRRKLKEVA